MYGLYADDYKVTTFKLFPLFNLQSFILSFRVFKGKLL